jgi:hypothetical protein
MGSTTEFMDFALRSIPPCNPPKPTKKTNQIPRRLSPLLRLPLLAYHLVIAKTTFMVENVIRTIPTSQTVPMIEFCSNSELKADIKCQSWTTTANLKSTMPDGSLDEIDPYSGLSNKLLLLINEIVDVKRQIAQKTPLQQSGVIRTELLRIHTALMVLQQEVPGWISATNPDLAVNLKQTAEANRLAALILLCESFPPSASMTAELEVPKADDKRGTSMRY